MSHTNEKSRAAHFGLKVGQDKRTGQVRPSRGVMKVDLSNQQPRTWANHKRANGKRLLMQSPAGGAMVRTGNVVGRRLGHAVQSPWKKHKAGRGVR
jgi:hypothetical protein